MSHSLIAAASRGFYAIANDDPRPTTELAVIPEFVRARRALETEPMPERLALAGVLSFGNLLMARGQDVEGYPDFMTPRTVALDNLWLELVVGQPASTAEIDRLLGYAALALGRVELVRKFTSDPKLVRLMDAVDFPRDQASRRFADFVRGFPKTARGYGELGFAARAYFVLVEKKPALAEVAPWLHALSREGPGASTSEPARPASPLLAPDDCPPTIRPPFESIFLSESSHFWRGRSIAIDETGAVSVTSGSHPGAPAQVHRACLSDAGVREIDDLLRRHPVRTIVVTTMPAIPDEGSRTLSIVDAQGSHSVSRLIHSEQNASFDALAQWLDHIAGIVEASEG